MDEKKQLRKSMFISATQKNVFRGILVLLSFSCAISFNLDTDYPIIYNGSKGSYFGYTTALHRNSWGFLALVGAPRSNTTTFPDPVYQPGTLFRCNITGNDPQKCEEVLLMKEGAVQMHNNPYNAYTDKKDGMWLGVSLAVQPDQNKMIVTCGHLWKNRYYSGYNLVNGVCYVINGNLERDSIKKLLPLTVYENQKGKRPDGQDEFYHSYGQLGISATFSENGSNLLLGAPGVWYWKGSVVHYPGYLRNNMDFGRPDIPFPSNEISYDAYFGYSVAAGEFFGYSYRGNQFFAVGAPRDASHRGRVYIIRFHNGAQIIHLRKRGEQLGEYFGGSVLGININNDSYTDLLVGAPLNSQELGGDEGKVYVYKSNGHDLVKDIELTGDSKVGARFGTTLANIGDLNKDGYIDFAVGAPYEDGTGAVYIYHGSRNGVNPEYAQKIKASDIRSTLSGFGIHVSPGLDIDDNGYPDILVGSYASANAVLLRSRPVIYVASEITFTPQQINLNHTCNVRGKNFTCFQMEACVWRTGGAQLNTDMDFELVSRVDDDRATFFAAPLLLKTQRKTCETRWLHLKPNIKDYLTSIQVHLQHRLVLSNGSSNEFIKTFPMYHPSSQSSISKSITFHTGCKEEVCYSDLSVSVTRTEPIKSRLITLGEVSSMSIVITVKNNGEPAFLSELLIYFPPEMPIISQGDICEDGYTKTKTHDSLVCSLGNPLQNASQVEINIKLDARKIPPHVKYLEIRCEATTNSNDTNPEDNIEILPLHFQTVSDVGITGFTVQDQVMYETSFSKAPPPITQSYVVRNHGPSPVEKIDILLQVPHVFLTSDGQKPFVYFTVQVESGSRMSIPAVCEDTPLYMRNFQPSITVDTLLTGDNGNSSFSFDYKNSEEPSNDRTKRSDVNPTELEVNNVKNENVTDSANKRGQFVISCASEGVECISLRCSASPFSDLKKFSQLSIALYLNFSVLNDQLGQWYQIEFVTSGSISVSNKDVIHSWNHPKSTQVKTVILHEGPPPPGEIAAWIIFVSVGVGVLLLFIILIVLIKIGFFKRKEKDRMKEMLYDVQKEGTGNEVEQEPAEQETNDDTVALQE